MAEALELYALDHPIVQRLAQSGISKAAIIDDAYDDPTPENIPSTTREDFLTALEDSEPALRDLQELDLDLQSATDITKLTLDKLWSERENRPILGSVVDATLFAAKISKLHDVEQLESQLKILQVEPLRFKSTDQLPDPNIPLVFLDYVLGPDAPTVDLPPDPARDAAAAIVIERDPSVAVARDKAKSLGERQEKPFVVLMSNKARVDEEMAARLRADSGYLSGLFAFVKKSELADRDKLCLRLASWSLTLPVRHDIQKFVNAIEIAARSAADRLISTVRSIGLEDYVTVQAIGLQPDGHPLSDYMLWLYQSLIGYYILDHEEIRTQRAAVDKISFKKLIASENRPSVELAKIYRYALTEPSVASIQFHPRTPEGDALGKKLPALQLGDIFIKNAKQSVFMVINAACDLAMAPDAERGYNPSQPIFLVAGTLQPILEPIGNPDAVRTELFEYAKAALQLRFVLTLEVDLPQGGSESYSTQLVWRFDPRKVTCQFAEDWDRLITASQPTAFAGTQRSRICIPKVIRMRRPIDTLWLVLPAIAEMVDEQHIDSEDAPIKLVEMLDEAALDPRVQMTIARLKSAGDGLQFRAILGAESVRALEESRCNVEKTTITEADLQGIRDSGFFDDLLNDPDD